LISGDSVYAIVNATFNCIFRGVGKGVVGALKRGSEKTVRGMTEKARATNEVEAWRMPIRSFRNNTPGPSVAKRILPGCLGQLLLKSFEPFPGIS